MLWIQILHLNDIALCILIDVNECASNATNDCEPPPKGTCTNDPDGSYTCQCKSPYNGDGKLGNCKRKYSY